LKVWQTCHEALSPDRESDSKPRTPLDIFRGGLSI